MFSLKDLEKLTADTVINLAGAAILSCTLFLVAIFMRQWIGAAAISTLFFFFYNSEVQGLMICIQNHVDANWTQSKPEAKKQVANYLSNYAKSSRILKDMKQRAAENKNRTN
jgi:hypothetical protein